MGDGNILSSTRCSPRYSIVALLSRNTIHLLIMTPTEESTNACSPPPPRVLPPPKARLPSRSSALSEPLLIDRENRWNIGQVIVEGEEGLLTY